MDYTIEVSKSGFNEEEFGDINLCIHNLLSTIAGTLGGDRDFGINIDEIVDKPTEVAKNILSVEIIEKIDMYEPRVEVAEIEYESSDDGKLTPIIFFIKREDDDGSDI